MTPMSELMRRIVCPGLSTQAIPGRKHYLCSRSQLLTAIKHGQKTVDVREYADGRCLKPGELVVFSNWGREVTCRILTTKVYNSVREMLLQEGVTRCFPSASTVESGIRIYTNMTGSSGENKVVGFTFVPLERRQARSFLDFDLTLQSTK